VTGVGHTSLSNASIRSGDIIVPIKCGTKGRPSPILGSARDVLRTQKQEIRNASSSSSSREWCAVENALGTLGTLGTLGGSTGPRTGWPRGAFPQCETATNELRGLSAAIPNRLGGFTTTSFVFRGRVHPTPAHTDFSLSGLCSRMSLCRLGTDLHISPLSVTTLYARSWQSNKQSNVMFILASRLFYNSTPSYRGRLLTRYGFTHYWVQLHATVSRPLVYCPFRSLLCSTRAQLQARISAHARRAGRSIPCRPPKEPGGSEN
jgi:hypothetical protein